MFFAKLRDCGTFVKATELIQDFLEDGHFMFFRKRIEIFGSNTACQVHILLQDSLFESFQCENNMSFGFKCNSLAKMMKGLKDRALSISVNNENSDRIVFSFECIGEGSVEFSLVTISPPALRNLPDILYDCTFSSPTIKFSNIIRNLFTMGDEAKINCGRDGIRFTIHNDKKFTGSKMMLKAIDSTEIFDLRVRFEVTFSANTRFWTPLGKARGLSEQVNVCVSSDVLKMEYRIDTSEVNNGHIQVYFAPKLDDI